VGRDEANRILQERTITGVWRVRCFAPSRKDEVWRYVGTNGKVFRQDLVLDEKGPAQPTPPKRKLAETHASSHGVNLARYKLVDSSSEKHDQRTDHSFVWQDESFRVGEARARISVDILGSSHPASALHQTPRTVAARLSQAAPSRAHSPGRDGRLCFPVDRRISPPSAAVALSSQPLSSLRCWQSS
jgi:hypothetical protein